MPSRRSENDAIAAIATPPGRSAIGIVRVSGAGTCALLEKLVGSAVAPRRATFASFLDANGSVMDQGLVLFFPAPHSYTGEDVAELQGHGGPIVMQLMLQRCLELGARIAEPGEFTKRAFLNEKIDLAQAEGVADLIDAATVEAARCAVRSLEGEFSQNIRALAQALIDLRVLAEATIDFPEEEVDSLPAGKAIARLDELRNQLAATLAASKQGSLLRDGMHVVIAGEPNVGKSSLLNKLAGEDVAIVTDIPGTTRDTIRQTINVSGVPLHIIDTAGLREPQDPIENIGISKAWDQVSKADAIIWVSDATRPATGCAVSGLAGRLPNRIPVILALNKIDLCGLAAGRAPAEDGGEVRLSAKTGAGIGGLREAMLEAVGWSGTSGGLFLARERHLSALARAGNSLDRAAMLFPQMDLFAEELRLAHRALGEILGEFTADDLLGEIFSRFCIGK
jgi:tRNA modification GTPase